MFSVNAEANCVTSGPVTATHRFGIRSTKRNYFDLTSEQ